jgi:hydrogenase 3 maturation protease
MKKVLLTVGNELMGDDAAGPLLARAFRCSPVDGWELLEGGNAPENYVFKIREIAPEQVLIVDSADMGLQAGEVDYIDQETIGSLFLMTTHALPLSYLMEAIGEFVPRVELLGIQPEVVAFGYPVSQSVQQAVVRVYDWLSQDGWTAGATRACLRTIPNLESGGGGADEIDCSAHNKNGRGTCSS